MPSVGPLSSELSSQESVTGDVKPSSHSQAPLPGKKPLHRAQSSQDALAHSAAASQYLGEKDYSRALHSYQRALYLYQSQESTVGQCNAAATLHNMALLHITCLRYDDAVQCFQQAEDLYRHCAAHVPAQQVSQVEEGQVCLDYLLIETLHNRAIVHSKFQDKLSLAIECHDQVVERILGMDESSLLTEREPPVTAEDVVYVKMNNQQRVALLAESLKNLGFLYNQKGETEGALGALEEAVEVLKCQVAECPDDVEAKKSMATVLTNLASVYFGQEEFAEALESLQHAMDIWMDVEENPARTNVLATVNNMGLAHERMGNLDKALECYEDLLHVRSQVLGTDHVDVADSLTTVAKVLERQGNAEGALDLYEEALRIYQKAANDEDPSLWANAAEVLSRIGNILLEAGQVDESIEKFHEALKMEQHTLGETSEETASIYHGLGRAYMEKNEYDEARKFLLKAARMLEAVPNDGVQLDSLVESSDMLKQALNNESFLSSDGSWVNAEIDIKKTPERLALAKAMSPIGESSFSGDPDPDTTGDESPSAILSSSSLSSQLPCSSSLSSQQPLSSQPLQMQVYVHPSEAVDGSIDIEVSPLAALYKRTPSSPNRNEVDAIQEFDPYLSPSSSATGSRTSDPGKFAIDARQVSVLDSVDINSPLRSPASGKGAALKLADGSSDKKTLLNTSYTPIEETSPEVLHALWAAHQALSNDSSSNKEMQTPQHVVETPAVDVSALATPMTDTLARDKVVTVISENTTDDETEDEMHQRLMMEFSEYDSQTDGGTNTDCASDVDTADYTNDDANASDVDTADYTNDYTNASDVESTDYTNDDANASDVYSADYTNDEAYASDVETADYTNDDTNASDVETADYTNEPDDLNNVSASYVDSAPRNLSSVAEQADLSRSSNSASNGELQSRLHSTSVEESIRTESAVFRFAIETDAETDDEREVSTTYDDESNSIAETSAAASEHDTPGCFASQCGREFRASESARDRPGETDYCQLSSDNEESDVFGTDLDIDVESISLDESDHGTPRDVEKLGTYYEALEESPQLEESRRIVQLAVGAREERTSKKVLKNEEIVDAGEVFRRPAVETEHHWPTNESQQEDYGNETNEPLLASTMAYEREPQSPRDSRMNSPRVMLTKAFKHPFRRRSSRSRTRLDSMPENTEHHVPTPMVMPGLALPSQSDGRGAAQSFGPIQGTAPIGPIQVIDLGASSFDDNVSQITFLEEAGGRRRDSSGSWWWGASSEGEGWFPAVVGAAEEFLSARTIHDQIKSRKQETSSSDSTEAESDIFGDLSVDKTEKEGTASDETNGHTLQNADEPERNIEVDAEGYINVTGNGNGVEYTASPVFSETNKSEELRMKQSPPTTNSVAPSSDSGMRRRSSSPRRRVKVHELQKLLDSQRRQLGKKHPDVANTLTSIAILKSRDGETDVPVELLHEALHIRKSVGDRAEFARTLHKLGDVYARQGEFQSSLSCHTDALHLERLTYGYHHPEVAKTLNRIGSVNARRGEFSVAISNHKHALQILKDCVGEDLGHPLVTQTLICIGAVYYKERNSLETIRANSDGYRTFIEAGMLDVIARAHEQRGSYRMAIAFFEEKLQLLRHEDKQGMDKQEVAEALSRLGSLSREAGLYLEALDYYDETSNIQSALGRNQVEIAKGRLLKGSVLYHLGQYKESLKLLQEAQATLQAKVGDDQQVLIAQTFQWIGLAQIELCDYDSAKKALGKAAKIETKALGDVHPTTLKTRLAIATVLLYRAEMDASIEQLTAILEIQGHVHGPKHPNLAETLYYIGRAYDMKGDIGSAMKFFEESFFMAEEFLGHDHPAQASTLHSIADLQKKKRRFKKSFQLLTSVLTMRKEALGEGHISVAMTLCSIGACHAATGRFSESSKVLDDALAIAERAVGKTHPCVALIHVTMGHLLLRKCQFEQAKEMIEKGLMIYASSKVAKSHPDRLEAESMLERVERDEALCV